VTRRRESRRAASPPPPLGSMSQQTASAVPGTQTCSACGSTDLVRIRMGAPTGRPLVFVSCRACEQTAWFAQDGDGTPLTADGSPLRPAPGADDEVEPDGADEPEADEPETDEPETDEPDAPLAGNAR